MRFSLNSIFKHFLYSFILITLVIVQSTFFAKLEIFGARPQLVLLFVCTLSFFEGAKSGAVYGFIGGYVLDLICGGGLFFSGVIYMLICYLAAYAVELYFSDEYLPFLAISFAFLIAKHILDVFAIIANYKEINIFKTIFYIFLPETLYTLLLSAFIFFPIRLLCAKLNKDSYIQ